MKEMQIYLIEGGPVFMYPILYLIIITFILFIIGIISKFNKGKLIDLVSSFGWFTLILGITGSAVNLYDVFDKIQMVGTVNSGLLAGGLKIPLLSTIFGAIGFLIARLEMIILILIKKENN